MNKSILPEPTEEIVEKLAEKMLEKVKDKIGKHMVHEFYTVIEEYLYEHYANLENSVEQILINKLIDKYVSDPTNYKHAMLRKKIFEENKDVLRDSLTRDYIEQVLTDVFVFKRGNIFFQNHLDGAINDIIIKNIHSYRENNSVNNAISNELARAYNKIEQLEGTIIRIKEGLNELSL